MAHGPHVVTAEPALIEPEESLWDQIVGAADAYDQYGTFNADAGFIEYVPPSETAIISTISFEGEGGQGLVGGAGILFATDSFGNAAAYSIHFEGGGASKRWVDGAVNIGRTTGESALDLEGQYTAAGGAVWKFRASVSWGEGGFGVSYGFGRVNVGGSITNFWLEKI